MTADDLAKLARWRRTATTWVAKSAALLQAHHDADERDQARFLVAYEAGALVADMLSTLDLLVPLLDADANDLEQLRLETNALSVALRRQALPAKLRNTTGRTAAEAATFKAKADALGRETSKEGENVS